MIADLDKQVKDTRKKYGTAKQAILGVLAETYLVWRDVSEDSERHTDDGVAWLKKQIGEQHSAVEKHNGELADRETRGNLAPEADETTPIHRRMAIKLKEGGAKNPYLCAVKLVLELDGVRDASQASQYSTALAWIDENFGAEDDPTVDEIADAMKAAGGLTGVIEEERAEENDADGRGQTGSSGHKKGKRGGGKGSGKKAKSKPKPDKDGLYSSAMTVRLPSGERELEEGDWTCTCNYAAGVLTIIGIEKREEKPQRTSQARRSTSSRKSGATKGVPTGRPAAPHHKKSGARKRAA